MCHDHVVPGAEGGRIKVGGELLRVLVRTGTEDHGHGCGEDPDRVARKVGRRVVIGRDRP